MTHSANERWALAAGVLVALGGVLLVVVHYLGGTDGDPEGWLAAIGFGAPFVAAGLLASLGVLVDAPWQWWAAGIALVPMSFVSVVLFPLLAPATALIVVGFRNGLSGRRDLWGGVLAGALIAAFSMIVFHQDRVTWTNASGSIGGSSSNIVTTTEATASIVVAVCVLVVGWAVAVAPERGRSIS